jgi:hypothetical protein
VPLPKAGEPEPLPAPKDAVPSSGEKMISLPASQWAYPAYGEQPRRVPVAEAPPVLTKGR